MKLTIDKPTEIEASAIRVVLPVRYQEEDIPNNFPLRRGDTWEATIDIATGQIQNWPEEAKKLGECAVNMKVCDEGCYYLLDSNGNQLAAIEQDYVPSCIPEEYGDYVRFMIDANGKIASWSDYCRPAKVQAAFFRSDDE